MVPKKSSCKEVPPVLKLLAHNHYSQHLDHILWWVAIVSHSNEEEARDSRPKNYCSNIYQNCNGLAGQEWTIENCRLYGK